MITLLTDFGLTHSYAAEMKGVIPSICPKTCLVDTSHKIAPQNIAQAAFVLAEPPHVLAGHGARCGG